MYLIVIILRQNPYFFTYQKPPICGCCVFSLYVSHVLFLLSPCIRKLLSLCPNVDLETWIVWVNIRNCGYFPQLYRMHPLYLCAHLWDNIRHIDLLSQKTPHLRGTSWFLPGLSSRKIQISWFQDYCGEMRQGLDQIFVDFIFALSLWHNDVVPRSFASNFPSFKAFSNCYTFT